MARLSETSCGMNEPGARKPKGPKRRRMVVEAPEELPPDETREATAGRGGLLSSMAKLLLLVALLLGAVSGFAYAANRFFVTTARFGIEQVRVEGSRRFGDGQVLALAGIARGDNLFALDLEQAERALTSNPWIHAARLTRRIPDTLEIQVEEHSAAALAAIDSALYLVTQDGTPIKPVEEGDVLDYPVVTGISAEALRQDRTRALERIAAGVAIASRYDRLSLAKAYAAQEIHMADDGSVSLVVGERGITFHLGKGPFRQKMLMAARVMGKLRARQQTPSIIFLDNQAHPERVVVRMR